MKNAAERAKDAEDAFVAMLMSKATDAEVADGLNSVFSTNPRVLKIYQPGRAATSFVSFRDRDEYRFFFKNLLPEVLLRKNIGEAAYLICAYVRNAAEKINLDVLGVHSVPPHLASAKETSHLSVVK